MKSTTTVLPGSACRAEPNGPEEFNVHGTGWFNHLAKFALI